jgi:hypothetical protein
VGGFAGFTKGFTGVIEPKLEANRQKKDAQDSELRKYWLGVALSMDKDTPDAIRQQAEKELGKLYGDKESKSLIQRAAGMVGKIRGKVHGQGQQQASPAGAVPPMQQSGQQPSAADASGAETGGTPQSPAQAPAQGQPMNGVPPRPQAQASPGAVPPRPQAPPGPGQSMVAASMEANAAKQRQSEQTAQSDQDRKDKSAVNVHRQEKAVDTQSTMDVYKQEREYDAAHPDPNKVAPKKTDIHYLSKADGEWHLGKEDAQGNKFTQDEKPVDPTDVMDVSKSGPKPEKFTGELGQRLAAQAIIDNPKSTPSEVKQAKAQLKKLDAAATSVTIRNEVARENAGVPVTTWDKTGEDALKGQPEIVKALVRSVAHYDQKLPSGFALKSEPWKSVAALAPLYSGGKWKEYNYDIARSMKQDYTNTKGNATGAKIISLNTLTQHLDTFEQAANAMNAKDTRLLNKFINEIRTQTGSKQVTNFETARTAIADELATALKQSGATDVTIGHWRENFQQASSKGQFKGAIQEAYNLMAGRLKPLKEEYEQVIGNLDVPIVLKSSKPYFEAHGINPDTLEPKQQASPKGQVGPMVDPKVKELRNKYNY